jgi:predicted GH43/DUF377 family glycosyl hydrolase
MELRIKGDIFSVRCIEPHPENDKNRFRLLSPKVQSFDGVNFLSYSEHSSESDQSLQGQLRFDSSENLLNWNTKVGVYPPNPPFKFCRYIAPDIIKHCGKYRMYFEGRSPEGDSNILMVESESFGQWNGKEIEVIKAEENVNYGTPFVLKDPNKSGYIIYYYKRTTEKYWIRAFYSEDGIHMSDGPFDLIKQEEIDETYSAYGASVYRVGSEYLMLYSGWKDQSGGVVKFTYSKDPLKWDGPRKVILDIKAYPEFASFSEPSLYISGGKIILFFETKKNGPYYIAGCELELISWKYNYSSIT